MVWLFKTFRDQMLNNLFCRGCDAQKSVSFISFICKIMRKKSFWAPVHQHDIISAQFGHYKSWLEILALFLGV